MEEEEEQWESFDDRDDVDYEPLDTEEDDHDSDPEVDLDPAEEDHDGDAETELDDLSFYIGRDGETLWANKTVAAVSKTKSKNIIKVLPGPKGQARLCKTRLECFLQIISAKMVNKIVKYTNIFINKKRLGREATSTTEV
jgi:hypothetical protein